MDNLKYESSSIHIIPKITNGSEVTIGESQRKLTIILDKHFNWFQKKMIKWCFGFNVTDYKEE